MSRSKLAVVALLVLVPGVLAGWGCWQLVYPLAEPFLLALLGGPLGAMALWLLSGAAMGAGYWAALRVGSRFLQTRPSAEAGAAPNRTAIR